MFERFSNEARTVVIGAQGLARELGTRSIDTRHLLLCLLELPGPTAGAVRAVGVQPVELGQTVRRDLLAAVLDADALASLGIDLDAVRRQADEVFGAGALDRVGRTRRGNLPFARDAKKALELALRETIRLGDRTIKSEHLLLGILRADCPARAAVIDAGADVEALRSAIEEHRAA